MFCGPIFPIGDTRSIDIDEPSEGEPHDAEANHIAALTPRGNGHSFVFYGDACSGIPGHPHAENLARTNAAIDRLTCEPDFVVFAGDEIVGLTTDEAELRAQWRHWLDVEMAWLDRTRIPLYNTTSNHTTYDAMSERVFTEVLDHLPRNGPADQPGLSYFVRREDLLLVFVHTGAVALGGEGHVETSWLDSVLTEHSDAATKLVIGHHPVFAVNGFSGERQREVGSDDGRELWRVLVHHGVVAYLCSHILAFDAQAHEGVLQIVSAGAATGHRMPEGIEYLHFVQAVVDDRGLRYQVIDQSGAVRERLTWPLTLPTTMDWMYVPVEADGERAVDIESKDKHVVAWRFEGLSATGTSGAPQTLVSTKDDGNGLPTIWIGLTGADQRLTVTISPEVGRSPHYWFGPSLSRATRFDFQLAMHFGMGPGGLLYRETDSDRWSSLTAASPWGLERVGSRSRWTVAATSNGVSFRGTDLQVSFATLRH